MLSIILVIIGIIGFFISPIIGIIIFFMDFLEILTNNESTT